MSFSLSQRLAAEFIGTAFLLGAVIGSGIMAVNLSDGNVALSLLANTIATGAILYVLIAVLGPVSGAHFNPAVTLAFRLNGDINSKHSAAYIAVQIMGAIVGVGIAHIMFEAPVFQISMNVRTGIGQYVSEWVATFGLVFVILACVKVRLEAVPMVVGLYITAAYWFTASTSFANPAVTFARSFSDSFAGIRPVDAPMFVILQLIAAVCAWAVFRVVYKT